MGIQIQYKGETLPVFTVEPHWATPVKLRVMDRVLVFSALDWSEERLGTRPRPLYGLDYATKELSEQETGWIRRVVELPDALPFIMPLWPDKVRLLGDVAAGALAFPVDSTAHSLWSTLNRYALIWRSFKQWELIDLSNVDDGFMVSPTGAEQDWAGDGHTYLIPILIGWLSRADKRNLDANHGVFQVRFEERFLSTTDNGIEEIPPEEPTPEESASIATGFHDGEYSFQLVVPVLPESGSVSSEFVSGEYLFVVIPGSAADAGTTNAGFEAGAYAEVVVPLDAGSEDAQLDAQFRSGLYREVIIPLDLGGEDASSSSAFQEGEYLEVIEPLDLGDEEVSSNAGFLIGSYNAA